MRVRRAVGIAVVALACPPAVASDAFLIPLGLVPGVNRPPVGGALSGDGQVFYTNFRGTDTLLAYSWTPKGGYEPVALPATPNVRGAGVWASSRDGRVAGGSLHFSLSPLGTMAAVWRDGPRFPPTLAPNFWTVVRAVSADGSAWGGDANTGIYRNGVWVQFSTLYGDVNGLSENGGVAVGQIEQEPGQPFVGSAFVWSEATGVRRLPAVPGFTTDYALRVTPDGSLVAGVAGEQGGDARVWLWSETTGRSLLEAPFPGALATVATYLAGEGRLLGATFFTRPSQYSSWVRRLDDPAGGWVRFDDHLARFGVSTVGWSGLRFNGVSEDGLTFAGTGILDGVYQHWYARIPAPPALLALAGLLAPRRRRCA